MSPNLKLLPILSAQEEGFRLRQLRREAGVNQAAIAEYLGYEPGQSGNVSKIETGGKASSGEGKRKVANFLAGKGRLTDDAYVLHGYLVGDHDSLDACMRTRGTSVRTDLRDLAAGERAHHLDFRGQEYVRFFAQTPDEQDEEEAA